MRKVQFLRRRRRTKLHINLRSVAVWRCWSRTDIESLELFLWCEENLYPLIAKRHLATKHPNSHIYQKVHLRWEDLGKTYWWRGNKFLLLLLSQKSEKIENIFSKTYKYRLSICKQNVIPAIYFQINLCSKAMKDLWDSQVLWHFRYRATGGCCWIQI